MITARSLVWWVLVVSACEPEVVTSAGSDAARPRRGAPAASASAVASAAAVPSADFQEVEFRESDRSRDPFRAFLAEGAGAEARRIDRENVLLDKYSIEELKLIGIVQRADPPVAMLLDPTGRGHTVKRGQFVGKPEIVQLPGQRGAGAAYEIYWRVDRIRDGDVVFVREDPQNPDVPGATKVVPLRVEGELSETSSN